MKNVMYVLLLAFCLLGNTGYSQIVKLPNQISSSSGKQGEPDFPAVYLNENCDFVQEIIITVTHLDEIWGDPCSEVLGVPTGYPDMHLRVWINGEYSTTPITSFSLESCDEGETPTTYIFRYYASSNFYTACENAAGQINLQLNVSAQLAMKENNEWFDYPVCNYSGAGELFDCGYYGNAESGCTSTTCNNVPAANSAYSHNYLQCGAACIASLPAIPHQDPEDKGDYDEDGNPRLRMAAPEFSFTAHPNPFSNQVNLHWQNSATDGTLRVMDTSGRLIKAWSVEDAGNINWDTSDLPKGMYILEVKDGTEMKFLKLVKS